MGNRTYAQYFSLNDKYKEWFNKVVKYGIVNYEYAPNFDTLPKSLQNKLKTYIVEQTKKKKKKKRKESEDSTESESESESEESEENEIGNLEDVLDQNQLA